MIIPDKIPLRKRIALDLYSLKKSLEAKIHTLDYLFWECTTSCNFNCVHCGSDCTQNPENPDMPAHDFLNVLKNIKNHADPSKIVVAITGGEPLMRKDLEEAGRKIHTLGYPWGIVTNGYLLTKKRFENLMNGGMSSLAISLDGFEKEHDWFRGKPGSYKRALEAVKLAGAVSEKKLFFDVVTCVNKRNIRTLDKLKDLLIDAGVRKWRVVSVFPKGRARDNQEVKLDGSQLRWVMEFIRDTRREGKIIASYGCEGFLDGYEMEVRDIPFFCRAGIGIGSVLVDGSISACSSLREDYIQGNIYKDDFWDVWNNRFKVMRNRNWAKTGECKTCSMWKYCKGNGLHLRDEKSGELLFCNYRALLEK